MGQYTRARKSFASVLDESGKAPGLPERPAVNGGGLGWAVRSP